MRQSYTVLEEILSSGAPFEEGFSFAVEKPAGPMRKRSLHYTEAPGKIISPRTLIFSREKKPELWHLQVGCNYERNTAQVIRHRLPHIQQTTEGKAKGGTWMNMNMEMDMGSCS